MAGWGRTGQREEALSMHCPYVREMKGSLALDAETSEGRTDSQLAGRGRVQPVCVRPPAEPQPTQRRPERVCSTPVYVTAIEHEH